MAMAEEKSAINTVEKLKIGFDILKIFNSAD